MSTKTIVFILATLLAISICASARYMEDGDYPKLPRKPENFISRKQWEDFFLNLRRYYFLVNRPRFGRSFSTGESVLKRSSEVSMFDLKETPKS